MLEAKSEWSHQSIHANWVRRHYVTQGECPPILFIDRFPKTGINGDIRYVSF